jgi:glycosyltransferase involved in cell wall biosynthesis
VIDDGSQDETSKIQIDFPQIKYIYQKNSGVSSARNLGIEHAKNEWIAFLDSDDEWHTDKLHKQVEFHKNNSDILISYTDELWIKDDKEVKVPKKFKKYGGDIFEKSLGYCNIAPSSVIINKRLFSEIGIFDESLEVCEDYDLWLRIALNNKIGLVDEKLIVKYAGHEDQLSFKHWGMDRFRVIALEKLLKLEDFNSLASKRKIILNELIKKYTLLLKGAVKYDRIPDIKIYEKRLKELKHELN